MLSRRTLLTSSFCLAAGSVQSQVVAWPSRPVNLVVGYPPAGATDLIARLVATRLTEQLGQRVVVENRPGANSNIASAAISRSPPDGYSLLLFSVANTINASLYPKLAYDPLVDFDHIGLIAKVPNILVVHPALPIASVAEYQAHARSSDKGITFASSGAGSSIHLSGELFKAETRTPMLHVPYRGSAPAMHDLVAGVVDSMFDNAPSALPQIKAGKLRALAVTGAQRLEQLPGIPTLAESGLPGFDVQSWFGLAAPAGTPKAIIQRLNQELAEALSHADLRARLHEMAATPQSSSPEQMRQFAAAEVARWRVAVKAAGVALE